MPRLSTEVAMRVMLVDDDGNVVETWSVEHDFGDVTKAVARAEMARLIAEAIAMTGGE